MNYNESYKSKRLCFYKCEILYPQMEDPTSLGHLETLSFQRIVHIETVDLHSSCIFVKLQTSLHSLQSLECIITNNFYNVLIGI